LEDSRRRAIVVVLRYEVSDVIIYILTGGSDKAAAPQMVNQNAES